MTAYLLFIREGAIVDPAAMDSYRALNRGSDFSKPFSMKPLAVYGAMEALEGEAPDGVVLLQFPTREDARGWYESPEYRAATEHRKRAAPYRVLLIEGL